MAGRIDVNKLIVAVDNETAWQKLIELSDDKLLSM
jgi:hypothetical protein